MASQIPWYDMFSGEILRLFSYQIYCGRLCSWFYVMVGAHDRKWMSAQGLSYTTAIFRETKKAPSLSAYIWYSWRWLGLEPLLYHLCKSNQTQTLIQIWTKGMITWLQPVRDTIRFVIAPKVIIGPHWSQQLYLRVYMVAHIVIFVMTAYEMNTHSFTSSTIVLLKGQLVFFHYDLEFLTEFQFKI